jgi:putative ABC transport system permease protein
LRPVMWGALIGGIGAAGVSAVVWSLVSVGDMPDLTFGAGAFNPVVFGGVLATLVCAVVAACCVPAQRAARVDPVVALRVE